MSSHMTFKVASIEESFVTSWTYKGSLPCVSSDVFHEVAWIAESLVTMGAHVGSVYRMSVLMPLDIPGSAESLITNRTQEWLASCARLILVIFNTWRRALNWFVVRPLMPFEITKVGKSFVTSGTLVGFFICVSSDMFLEVARITESFCTV